MQFMHCLLVAAIAISQARADYVLVRSVSGANTIVVSNAGRVRLLGIDTTAAFDRQARDRLAGLVLNRWVRLEHDDADGGRAARRSVYVVTGDGTFVNAVLVREGLARVSARAAHTAAARLAELQRAEAEAQAFHRGLWARTAQTPRARYKRSRERHPCRVRLAPKDSRAHQALFPFQPLADLHLPPLLPAPPPPPPSLLTH